MKGKRPGRSRPNLIRGLARVTARLDDHDGRIGDLEELTAEDAQILRRHEISIRLLKQLAKNQDVRISGTERALRRIRRRVQRRLGNKNRGSSAQ